jgi:phosphatidylinositol alpha-mannosyltransferase
VTPGGSPRRSRKLLDDPAERDRLALAGRSRAGAFDWDRVAERAWALYRSL